MKFTDAEKSVIMKTLLTDVGVSINTAETLRKVLGVSTVGQLLNATPKTLLEIKTIGRTRYVEIMRAVSRCGFTVQGVQSNDKEIAQTLYRIGVRNVYTQESWMIQYEPKR